MKFRIEDEVATDQTSGNFVFRSLGVKDSDNSWISQCTQTIVKSKHVFPNLKILNFYTKTFYESKAKIDD